MLGALLFAVLITGAVCVCWFTGISTSALVLCLVQLDHQELSAQLTAKLDQHMSQATSLMAVTLASSTLLMSSGNRSLQDGAVLNTSSLLHDLITIEANARAGSPPGSLATYLTPVAWTHPGMTVHLATSEGAYIGLQATGVNDTVRALRRPTDGCLREVRISAMPMPIGAAMPPTPDPIITPSCVWRPEDQAWYHVRDSCNATVRDQTCWSVPYRSDSGSAVALQYPLSGGRGVVAVELSLLAFESYMRTLINSNDASAAMDAALVDGQGAMLAATSDYAHRATFAVSSPSNGLWYDVQRALQRKANGEKNDDCFPNLTPDAVDDSYCVGYELGPSTTCARLGPLPISGECSLISECQASAVANHSSIGSTFVPEGWTFRMVVRQSDYYPGFNLASFLTFFLSIGCSAMVSLLLSRIVWLYDTANGKLDLRICGKYRISPNVARYLLLLVVVLNYFVVYICWYSLFKRAAHGWRDAIIQALNEAMVDRLSSILEVLPRTAHIIRAWEPLWNTSDASSTSPSTSPSTLHTTRFATFAAELMHAMAPFALSLNSSGNVMPSAPPAGRVVVDSALMSVMHVPANSTGALEGIQRSVHGRRAIYQRTDECGSQCVTDPRRAPWWTAAIPVEIPSKWSEVHLLGDQLAVSFVLPIGIGRHTSWITCALPLVSLRSGFSVGTGLVKVSGFVMQRDTAADGAQGSPLVASSAGDAEMRFAVGGEWFTARRMSIDSVDRRVRNAAFAVARTLADPVHAGHAMYMQALIQGAPGSGQQSSRLRDTVKRQRVYRTFGAPRTLMTILRGSGCTQDQAGQIPVSPVPLGCGLDWTAILLIDWIDFFSGWSASRRSLCLCEVLTLAHPMNTPHRRMRRGLHWQV